MSTRDESVVRIEDALTVLFRIINGRDADKVRMQRAGTSITRPRMSLLRALHDRGPMRIVDLGAINHMDKGYASRAWRALEADGYIEVVDTADVRSTTVALTDRGREVYRRWRSANTEIIDDVLHDWPDPDLATLTGLLERLTASFRGVPVPSGSGDHPANG